MPKVLRIINRFNLGGPTFNAAYLSRYMTDPYETLLVGGQKDESEAGSEFIVEGLGITPLVIPEMNRSIGINRDLKAYKKIKEIIGDYKPDLVHTHASKAGALGRIAAWRMKVPAIVHTFHGNVFKGYFGPVKTGLYKSFERRLASISTAIVAISDLQKQELVHEHKICKADKIHVIPLGFDLSRFRENQDVKRENFRKKWGIAEHEIAISIVGRLVPIKNHHLFLDAVSILKERGISSLRAIIVGDGESRQELENYCREKKLRFEGDSPEVIFTGWIKEIDQVNAGSDIIALTSLNEGTPVSLIEAQASGRPIVSTDVGGIRNIVLPGETALLCASGDSTGIANEIARLVEFPEQRKHMSTQGWPYVEQRFHYTRLVNDMTNLYNQLLNK